jgi:hypothetical protein
MKRHEKMKIEFEQRCPWGPGSEGWEKVQASMRANATPEERKAGQAVKDKYAADLLAFSRDMDAEIDSMLPQIGAQGKALLGERPRRDNATRYGAGVQGDKNYAHDVHLYRERARDAFAAGGGEAQSTLAKKCDAPAGETVVALTPAAIGADIIGLTTHSNPQISAQARHHVNALARLASSQSGESAPVPSPAPVAASKQALPRLPFDVATLAQQPEEEQSRAMRDIRGQMRAALDGMDDLDKQNAYIAAVREMLPFSLRDELMDSTTALHVRTRRVVGLSTSGNIQTRRCEERPTAYGSPVVREVVTQYDRNTKAETTVSSTIKN